MTEQTDYRRDLARIETKLDRVETAIVGLARIEERMVTLFNRMDRYDGEFREMMTRVAGLERVTLGRGHFFRWMDRGGIAMLSAAIAYIFSQWKG